MDPKKFCQAFFGVGIAVDLGGLFSPWFKQNVMNYGSRQQNNTPKIDGKSKKIHFGDSIASMKVPHSWFTSYYVFSVASSAFWGYQIYNKGAAFRFLAAHSSKDISQTMSRKQAWLIWFLMAIQGSRRLYESLVFTKPSQSRMSIVIWAIGIAYYFVTGIGVWIEGITSLNTTQALTRKTMLSWPSIRSLIAIAMFTVGSITQHICHRHLASLKKYTLPYHTLFQSIVCPHYTSECLVYLALAIGGAPPGQMLNRTILSGFLFVVANLSVTANSTRNWYMNKFGVENVKGRWRIMPLIY